jgi:predicted methyltransferase
MRRLLPVFAACVAAATPLAANAAPATPPDAPHVHATPDAALAAVLADPRREADRARDAYRHPAETLAFFRVQPGMTVIDYMPSGGWYTRILVPYLGERGRYIGLNPDVTNAPEQMRSAYGNMAASFPAKASGWTGVAPARILAYNTDTIPAALNGTVDRALIMREIHNLKRTGLLASELKRIHALLKPDGLLGIEQHRARADAPAAYADGSKGYMREADVIAAITAQGFELVAKSEINANPKDTADYPGGVWTLPPSNRGGEADRARYQAIGESDRMTLLFRKR